MAQKYYNSEEAAKIVGVSTDEIKQMLDRRELHGYRDGGDWKFKVEEVERIAEQRSQAKPEDAAERSSSDVLLSEVTLGGSDPGTSGTVIAMEGIVPGPGKSDIDLGASNVEIGTGTKRPPTVTSDALDSKVTQFENLTLDEDVSEDDGAATMMNLPNMAAAALSGSEIDLGGKALEDDDLVLGGSSGSNVSIGGDSGISLVDPTDSGLSLEEPLNLTAPAAELELGEEEAHVEQKPAAARPAAAAGTSDFLLTPLEESIDVDGSGSGSQIIALDTEAEDEGMGMGAAVAAEGMLDEDLAAQPVMDLGMGAPLASSPIIGGQPARLIEGAPLVSAGSAAADAPYTGWQIAGLSTCAVLLALCGMMMFDNLRNMWSWQAAFSVNSSIMDTVLGLFGIR